MRQQRRRLLADADRRRSARQKNSPLVSTTSFLTTTNLIYTRGAGITAAAGQFFHWVLFFMDHRTHYLFIFYLDYPLNEKNNICCFFHPYDYSLWTFESNWNKSLFFLFQFMQISFRCGFHSLLLSFFFFLSKKNNKTATKNNFSQFTHVSGTNTLLFAQHIKIYQTFPPLATR